MAHGYVFWRYIFCPSLAQLKCWSVARSAFNYHFIYIYVCVYMYMCIHVYVYTENTLRMSRNHFSPNILRKTHKARLLGRGIGVFREFENWKQLFYCVTYRVILHRDISRSTASCMYMRFPVPRLDPPTRSFVTRGGGY